MITIWNIQFKYFRLSTNTSINWLFNDMIRGKDKQTTLAKLKQRGCKIPI